MNDYLKVLFEPSELVCFGRTIYDTKISGQQVAGNAPPEFIALNSFKTGGKREDDSVAVFRNFLIEVDKIPVEDQMPYIASLGMPFSTCVYSGGKSLHFVISLEEPLTDIESYRKISSLLLDDVVTLADKSNKNPSKFTRFPGTIRASSGRPQEIIDIRQRVTTAELLAFLSGHVATLAKKRRQAAKYSLQRELKAGDNLDIQDMLNPRTKRFLKSGLVAEGDRHHELKLAVVDLFRAGADEGYIENLLEPLAIIMGIHERGDLPDLIKWAMRKI